MHEDSQAARTAGSLPRVVGARRRGMTLNEACAQLVADAQDERDPFMRDLLLATAAGAMAEEAFKRIKTRAPQRRSSPIRAADVERKETNE